MFYCLIHTSNNYGVIMPTLNHKSNGFLSFFLCFIYFELNLSQFIQATLLSTSDEEPFFFFFQVTIVGAGICWPMFVTGLNGHFIQCWPTAPESIVIPNLAKTTGAIHNTFTGSMRVRRCVSTHRHTDTNT